MKSENSNEWLSSLFLSSVSYKLDIKLLDVSKNYWISENCKNRKPKETTILTSVQIRPNLDFINISNEFSCLYSPDKRRQFLRTELTIGYCGLVTGLGCWWQVVLWSWNVTNMWKNITNITVTKYTNVDNNRLTKNFH